MCYSEAERKEKGWRKRRIILESSISARPQKETMKIAFPIQLHYYIHWRNSDNVLLTQAPYLMDFHHFTRAWNVNSQPQNEMKWLKLPLLHSGSNIIGSSHLQAGVLFVVQQATSLYAHVQNELGPVEPINTKCTWHVRATWVAELSVAYTWCHLRLKYFHLFDGWLFMQTAW